MTMMENLYHEDVVMFFSIAELEEILGYFKNYKYFKEKDYNIMSLNSREFIFNSGECLKFEHVNTNMIGKLRLKHEVSDVDNQEEKDTSNRNCLIRQSEREDKVGDNAQGEMCVDSDCTNLTQGQETSKEKKVGTEIGGGSERQMGRKNERREKEKKSRNNHLFSEKKINDADEFITRKIFRFLYNRHGNVKWSSKHKLVISMIIQAIIYAKKIKLDIYKINLFLSIILMTMHKILDNLKEKNKGKKKKKKNKKKNSINYFINLINKNIHYSSDLQYKKGVCKSEEVDLAHVRSINGDTQQGGEIILPRIDANVGKYSKGNKKVTDRSKTVCGKMEEWKEPGEVVEAMAEEQKNHILTNAQSHNMNMNRKQVIDTETEGRIETATIEENMNNSSNPEITSKKMENNKNDFLMPNVSGHKLATARITVFNYEEATYIIKYIFENIFSIYNILEYLFLFSPVCVNLSYANTISAASPPDCLFTSDVVNDDIMSTPDVMTTVDVIENDELATNEYIKEALDIPMFVLNKFYSSITQLRDKIDQIMA
ncbi:hypothetical protein, conserved [Plasmodium gonderi]|uniref:Uncharacterized protein n=1 Tax=Plasmodium gonderi TaxID=77519 RepID=A0A1Y1JBS7_PLAGO|nr:hypothetical protein, conserved [Plasmodium gonderi]GAW79946.1 hypothetical protein, conserved [Plasmodium gonderi]